MKPVRKRPDAPVGDTINDETRARNLISGSGRLPNHGFGKLEWVAEWWKEHAPELVEDAAFYPPPKYDGDDIRLQEEDWVRRAVTAWRAKELARIQFLLEGGFLSGRARELAEAILEARERERVWSER